jgi:Flp pilus assembly protein TadG
MMMPVRLRKNASDQGANLVEAAILIFLLLLLLLGVADMGRAYHTYITVINAAREGARLAVTTSDVAEIQAAVLREANGSNVDLSDATITVITGSPGDPARVTVEVDYHTLLGSIIGLPTFPIRASATFRVKG